MATSLGVTVLAKAQQRVESSMNPLAGRCSERQIQDMILKLEVRKKQIHNDLRDRGAELIQHSQELTLAFGSFKKKEIEAAVQKQVSSFELKDQYRAFSKSAFIHASKRALTNFETAHAKLNEDRRAVLSSFSRQEKRERLTALAREAQTHVILLDFEYQKLEELVQRAVELCSQEMKPIPEVHLASRSDQ